jgi:beta-lactamase class D
MKQRIGWVLLAGISLFACTPNNVKSDAAITKILETAHVKGTFALMENASAQFIISDLSMYKDSAFAPLNTFFTIPSLIALDRGYINHNASTWVANDSISFYQGLIEKIGRTDLLKVLDSIHYGKGILSNDLHSFWNDQSIKITADEQLGLIKKLYFNELPFQKRSQDIYKTMILKEDNANYKLSYIQGSEQGEHPASWTLGYIVENKHPYFFVMHVTIPNAQTVQDKNAKSLAVLKSILAEQGFLKGVR